MSIFKNLLLVLLLAVSVAGLSACPNSDVGDGPAEKAGEKIDDVADDVGDKIEDVGDKTEDIVD